MEFLTSLKNIADEVGWGVFRKRFDLRRHNLTLDEARKLVQSNPELIAQVVRSDVSIGDVKALAYRLEPSFKKFECLLSDLNFFAEEAKIVGAGPEGVWQKYFETNKWIFGFGLTLVSMGSLEGKLLEQVVQGASLCSVGKRADAVMKTRGLIASLCFVEIKRHDQDLLKWR